MTLDWLVGLRAIAEEESTAGRFSGAVLVARGGEQHFADAYGLADRERGVPNRLSTRFRIGSMNKMFTGTAIGQLIQAGKVDPAAPIGTYLREQVNQDVAAKVTVHHLLTHTGGTGDIFVPEYMARREQVRSIEDYLALFAERGLLFEPGARFEYSNFGFILLGAVIESASEQSYYNYVDEHVFAPAGMTRSGSLPEETAVPDLSVGYTAAGGPVRPNTDTLPYRGTPAGGGYTTVEDVWRFATALIGHRLLDQTHTALVTSVQANARWSGPCVCYGFFERRIYGIRSFGHSGGAPGMSAELAIYPDSGHIVAVLANMDPPVAEDACAFIYRRLPVTPT